MMDIKHLLSIYIKIKSNEGICPIHFFSLKTRKFPIATANRESKQYHQL